MSTVRTLVAAPRRWLRAIYDWTIRWADSGWGLTALFVIAFAESSFFPVPPDVLLIAIVAANPRLWLRAGALASIGSVLGACLGYYIGATLLVTIGQPIIDFYRGQPHWDRLVEVYNGQYGMWFLAIAAFTFIPYKVATIAAGATGMPLVPFLAISTAGRAARFFLVAGLLRLFGAPIRAFLDKHFDAMAVLFLALLIGGFLIVRLL